MRRTTSVGYRCRTMARKAIPQEECFFCGEAPCVCPTVRRSKLLKATPQPDTTGTDNEEASEQSECAD